MDPFLDPLLFCRTPRLFFHWLFLRQMPERRARFQHDAFDMTLDTLGDSSTPDAKMTEVSGQRRRPSLRP
jgi:hypothetical protein